MKYITKDDFQCVTYISISRIKAILHDFLKIQVCLNGIVNVIGEINKHLYCWKYMLKWLKTILFFAKYQILVIFRKGHKWDTKRCIDFNSAFLYSSYYIVTILRWNTTGTNNYGSIQFIWDLKTNQKIFILRKKIHPFQLSLLQETIEYPYTLGRGINREGFNFKLAMVKMCSTWPLSSKCAL